MIVRRLSAAALVAVAACGDGAGRATSAGVVDTPNPASPTTAAPPPLSEDAVQAVVDAVNAVDARAVALAVPKVANPEVRRFAARLGSAHRQKVTDRAPPRGEGAGAALLAPLRELQTAGASRLDAIPAGAAFDSAWVAHQVDVHREALALLDRIAPAARDGSLPALVAATRTRVAEHLDEARALQTRLR